MARDITLITTYIGFVVVCEMPAITPTVVKTPLFTPKKIPCRVSLFTNFRIIH